LNRLVLYSNPSHYAGITEIPELLSFCAEHNVLAQIEEIPMQQIQTAFGHMVRSDIRYRLVVDMRSLR
jgi:alcohol dehydrogenase (NADP+)